MKTIKTSLLILVSITYLSLAQAHVTPNLNKKSTKKITSPKNTFSADCDQPIAQTEQLINNVRARLLTGGDMWWNPTESKGSYIVPKRPLSEPQVSAIFAAGVWMGGFDPANNLKMAAQQYGSANGETDYFAGPLDPTTGTTEKETCAKWDRFFKVTSIEIEKHRKQFEESLQNNTTYQVAEIPNSIKGWPARGNRFFYDIHGFHLPLSSQGLADFWDQNANGAYEPDKGDYPILETRGCYNNYRYPDEMIFWIYNDAGGLHSESASDPIQMEVQVTAFAYQTNDQINDMTFQKYKLINRAIETIDSAYFGLWVDGDLGCFADDYIGCDTTRNLAYYYNQDAVDGDGADSCSCPNDVATYCNEVPILGIDFLRGPLDEFGRELGMSSFTYYSGGGTNFPIGQTAPSTMEEYYNYLSGSWRTGEPIEYGGDGYQEGTRPTSYVFPSAPNDEEGWSLCTASSNHNIDYNTIQSVGSFRLHPGAVNELIFGVLWLPDQDYPCPSIKALQAADDRAQCLFNNCFDVLSSTPDAPDMDIIELDQELILVLSNDEERSNNAYESYAEIAIKALPWSGDSLYRFEGYKIYQLADSKVRLKDISNPDSARLIFHVDRKNEVEKIYNWENISTPETPYSYAPILMNEGVQNQGIRHTFQVTEDQFATEDRKLVNHKKYYFLAVAYAHNEYEAFNPDEITGQITPYSQSRRNIGDGSNIYYTAIPRPTIDQNLNVQYGDGSIITRLDGIGAGGNFLDLSEASETAILEGNFNGELTYKMNAAPIEIQIINPLEVQDGDYILTFIDGNLDDETLENDSHWELQNLNNPNEVIVSDLSIEEFNEQIIPEYGFSVLIGQTADVGDILEPSNGAIGAREIYEPDAVPWFKGIADDSPLVNFPNPIDQIYDFVPTAAGQIFADFDPNQSLTTMGNGFWMPYRLLQTEPEPNSNIPFLSPIWEEGANLVNSVNALQNLNNVDIVFTSDKSKWSRCVIVETANKHYNGLTLLSPEGDRRSFDVRAQPSVGQNDQDGNNLPDPDGTMDEDGNLIEGMGWFPGYAIDVETGQRLNIFFGENSLYRSELSNEFPQAFTGAATGADMMWNPTDQEFIPASATNGFYSLLNFMAGSQHFIYVTRQPYDECAFIYSRLKPDIPVQSKATAMREVTWTCLPFLETGMQMNTYAEGLIPTDYRVQLRVDNPYQVESENRTGTGEFNYYPTYQFKLEGVEATKQSPPEIEEALDLVGVVPNPYYAYSSYETSEDEAVVKITNLPARCMVSIYGLSGRLVRQFQRNEKNIPLEEDKKGLFGQQIYPDLEWDLKNKNGQSVAGGVYLIHVDAGELGERTLKWFGVLRQ